MTPIGRRKGRVEAALELKGEERVIALADAMRAIDACLPFQLHNVAVEEFRAGNLSFDRVTVVYRHAMLHAGGIVPRDRRRLYVCPVCEVVFDG